VALRDQLNSDLHDAMRASDETRKTALRLAIASVKNAEIQAGKPLEDADVLNILNREVKQRRESIEEFRKGRRDDLVAKEEAEMRVILAYLPPQVSREEIVEAAKRVIGQVGATGPGDKAKVMPVIMAELRGKADGRQINEVVTELLAGG
jgi:uncharacterized protein